MGCTIRVQLPNGQRASVLRCLPPDVVECYTSNLFLPTQQEADLRAELSGFGFFQNAGTTIVGTNALRANLRENDTLAQIQPALDFFLARVQQLIAAQHAGPPPEGGEGS